MKFCCSPFYFLLQYLPVVRDGNVLTDILGSRGICRFASDIPDRFLCQFCTAWVTQQEIPCALRTRAISRESVIAARFTVNERLIVMALPVDQPWQQDDPTISRVLQNQVVRTDYIVQNTCNFSLKLWPTFPLTKNTPFLSLSIDSKQIALKLK
jgi:hypothetical protein